MRKYARKCSQCDRLMNEGYVIDNGLDYYCSEECLSKNFTKEQWEEAYKNGNNYWTTWEDKEEYQYDEQGNEVEI
jgi:hypothetical protein